MDKKDPDIIFNLSGQNTRVAFKANTFENVGANQNLQEVISKKGNYWKYDSAFDNTEHKLDNKKREKVPYHNTFKKKRPALDHIIPYVAFEQVHEERLANERLKGAQGRSRRPSIELAHAFKASVQDESNLRIVSFKEHSKHGSHQKRTSLGNRDKQKAEKIFNHYLRQQLGAFTLPEINDWHQGFKPEWSKTSLDKGNNLPPSGVITRSKKIAKT